MNANQWTTMQAHVTLPTVRRDIVVDELDSEATVYDPVNGSTYHFNETAYEVWKRCDGHSTNRQVATNLTDVYDVAFEMALDHVNQLVARFAHSGLFRVVPTRRTT